ncbi:helix-turn-helix transcriptional regulator [Enterobacter quasiroggenkampii]|uniref:helix-turn-helix transcriptional regulator n=1 Tax=Enterobacter quasiroggenkampii TaxID=2497436 RepID=UPI0021D2BE63|nr:LuxR C-terminal-related transcriptional regulator [Enterobacter quasiroggenkampii]MCU6278379.1 LuxR C-terminal-related transcriptional regulator [Enterobacter quasiroggenkampii]
MEFHPDCMCPLLAHKKTSEPDIVLFTQNRLVAVGLEHLMLAQFPSLRVVTVCNANAVESIITSLPNTKVIAVLSEDRAEALAQFRALLHLHRGSQLKLMMLAGAVSKALHPLLTSVRWLSLRASIEHILREIIIWLRSPAPFLSPTPLSKLTPRQRGVLFILAQGIRLHEVASALGISVKTVATHRYDIQSRLGISCWVDWLLLCAAVNEKLIYPDTNR